MESYVYPDKIILFFILKATIYNLILSSLKLPECMNGGNCKKLCKNNDCMTCYYKSFASHKKSVYWSSKNEIDPRHVFKNSTEKFIFNCDECKHEFLIMPNAISCNKWCRYCVNMKLCDNKGCWRCYEKSFLSHPKALYWSIKNTLTPRKVFKSSRYVAIFNCYECKHEFSSALCNISCFNCWCPYCVNMKLCGNDNCILCKNNSFASHPKSKLWSDKNGEIKPIHVFKNSKTKHIFDCKECNNDYIAMVENVTQGTWCNCVNNKTENKLYNWLKETKYNVEKQQNYKWCKNLETNRYLPFDFVIEQYKIIIELDGRQHMEQVFNWKSPEEIQKKDAYKMNKALENGYSVIRLLQEDVWKDKNNWNIKLLENIKKYDIPQCIYQDNKNEYMAHKKLMSYNNIKQMKY